MTEIMVCAVCGRVLDRFEPDDGSEAIYHHSIQDTVGEDHPAIPVPQRQQQNQMIGRCDFCNTDHPSWGIPARTFEWPGMPGQHSEGDWAACDPCKILVVKNHWDTLVRRAVLNSPSANVLPKQVIRARLVTMYNKLRKNIYGEPYPLERTI